MDIDGRHARNLEGGGTLSCVTEPMRVILEVGKKRRVVAGAMDWPGLDRWGTSEDDALAKLARYLPRYAGVAERAGLADEFARARDVDVVERVPGSSSTDFWGIAHVPSRDRARGPARRLTSSGGSTSCAPAGPTSTTSRPTSRAELLPARAAPAGRRDQIIRHVYANEPEQMSRKVEVRTPREVVLTPDGLRTTGRPTSTRSAPTTRRAGRRGPGRSSS